ncbi:MAG TPA: hypothetical protein EYP10_07955 [Armatimonadetes bacterium]|nr:hypothetical protein [Armatimonadota bacterium]
MVIDVLFAFTILFLSFFFSLSSSTIMSISSLDLLDRIDEQCIAVRIIDLLCVSPGCPTNWVLNVSSMKCLGLAESTSKPYVLSKRKIVFFFENLTLDEISSLLGLRGENYDLKFVLEPVFLSGESSFKLQLGNADGGFISSRLVIIEGSLFIFRVSVRRKS